MYAKPLNSGNAYDGEIQFTSPSLDALVSIHDVMPESMEQVGELVELCRRCAVPSPMLLIVPGKAWRPAEIVQIRRWQEQGCELAGHGWSHETSAITSWYHRVHRLLLSRNVAEHLSMSSDHVVSLIQRCSEWFPAQGLEPPILYVPPEWAISSVTNDLLRNGGFRMLETTTGIRIPSIDRHLRLPVLGFEADACSTNTFSQRFNQVCRQVAKRIGIFRISLHPVEQQFVPKNELERTLAEREWQAITYLEYYRNQVASS
ncbi:MAG: DUF2334 domain-containing protein [Planctomycetota bacterium]